MSGLGCCFVRWWWGWRACCDEPGACPPRPAGLTGPFAGEDFSGGAHHVDVVVCLAPLDVEVSAGQVHENFAIRSIGDGARDADGAGARAARPGDPAAALPRTHPHFAPGNDLHPVRVHALRKRLVVLDDRADLFQVNFAHILYEDDP